MAVPQVEPAQSILPPGMPAYKNFEELLSYDMIAARKHINQALKDDRGSAHRIEIVSGAQSAFARKELDYVRSQWEHIRGCLRGHHGGLRKTCHAARRELESSRRRPEQNLAVQTKRPM